MSNRRRQTQTVNTNMSQQNKCAPPDSPALGNSALKDAMAHIKPATRLNTKPERGARGSLRRMVRAEDVLKHDYPMALARNPNDDGAFDGGCPCGEIHGKNFEVVFHCWRSSCQYGCKYSGIHVSGALDRKTKMRIAKHIRDNNGWTNHTDWNLVVTGSNEKLSHGGE